MNKQIFRYFRKSMKLKTHHTHCVSTHFKYDTPVDPIKHGVLRDNDVIVIYFKALVIIM